MPLPVTPYYERRLRDLRTLSPAAAALAERIALDLQPQMLATSTEMLEAQLLDHLQEVAQLQNKRVDRLNVERFLQQRCVPAASFAVTPPAHLWDRQRPFAAGNQVAILRRMGVNGVLRRVHLPTPWADAAIAQDRAA